MRKFGLPALVDRQTEVLILGTLPSDLSLSKGQYYANPSNDFWKLVGAVLDQQLDGLTYESKMEMLKAHRIGLWDTYRNCVRRGSMDKDIVKRELNDFNVLKSIAPKLRLVCFNGKEAAKSKELLLGHGYVIRALPSSSSANRRNTQERLRLWRCVIR